MVAEENRETLYQDYVTVGLKVLAETYIKCHGGSYTMPSFIEMTHVQEKPKTKEQIIEHVKSLFKG